MNIYTNNSIPVEVAERAEASLQNNCSSPEKDIIAICLTMANCSVPGKRGAFLRRVALDVDDLSSQIRWHLGQALLMLELHPELRTAGQDDDPLIRKAGMPAAAQLLLRGYVVEPDKILFQNLSEDRRGGTIGGWIFHMFIDSAVYRALSALDRLAVLAWYAAELPEERIYFRSRKLAKVGGTLGSAESKALLEIAERPVLNLITSYRDGFSHSHTQKAYSRIAGQPPSDNWTTDEEGRVLVRPDWWDADHLYALGNAAYAQFRDALPLVGAICQKKWPLPD